MGTLTGSVKERVALAQRLKVEGWAWGQFLLLKWGEVQDFRFAPQ